MVQQLAGDALVQHVHGLLGQAPHVEPRGQEGHVFPQQQVEHPLVAYGRAEHAAVAVFENQLLSSGSEVLQAPALRVHHEHAPVQEELLVQRGGDFLHERVRLVEVRSEVVGVE